MTFASIPSFSFSPLSCLTAHLPPLTPNFVPNASSAVRLVSASIPSAKKGHPLARRPESEVKCAPYVKRFFLAITYLTTITPSKDEGVPKVLSWPLLPRTLFWPLAKHGIFCSLLLLLKNAAQLILYPFLSPRSNPASLCFPVSSRGIRRPHQQRSCPESQKTHSPGSVSSDLRVFMSGRHLFLLQPMSLTSTHPVPHSKSA